MRPELSFGLLVNASLASPETGARFLALLFEEFPSLAPERYGNYEPLPTAFQSINECLSAWTSSFMWSRAKPSAVKGAAFLQQKDVHNGIFISASFSRSAGSQFLLLLERLARSLSPDFAYVHALTQDETECPEVPYEAWYSFRVGVSTHELRKGIPHLAWATVVGAPYVELIGVDRLRSAPAFRVKELSPRLFLVQLTESLEDLKSSFAEVNQRRRAVMSHLGMQYFWPKEGGTALVPQFRFPAIP